MDEEKETQDAPKDVSSEVSSEEPKTSSQKPEKLSQEAEIEKEVQKRVSDRLSKKGDEAVVLRKEVDALKVKDEAREAERFAVVAAEYNLTVEQLKDAGITEADKVKAYAALFGKKPGDVEVPSAKKPDSGTTIGGAGMPDSAKGKMRAGWDEMHK